MEELMEEVRATVSSEWTGDGWVSGTIVEYSRGLRVLCQINLRHGKAALCSALLSRKDSVEALRHTDPLYRAVIIHMNFRCRILGSLLEEFPLPELNTIGYLFATGEAVVYLQDGDTWYTASLDGPEQVEKIGKLDCYGSAFTAVPSPVSRKKRESSISP